ncbi:hypothetical protein BJF96_g10316 [Verticillium dahliae]|uniref:Uncharacterized protein n=1 Tax=Verticillium dahliae TaxID=27337 RepID=A0AA45AGR5_VERDA|nr:hypothetical protein BJF96_g10316 [Verticillium dahliae]
MVPTTPKGPRGQDAGYSRAPNANDAGYAADAGDDGEATTANVINTIGSTNTTNATDTIYDDDDDGDDGDGGGGNNSGTRTDRSRAFVSAGLAGHPLPNDLDGGRRRALVRLLASHDARRPGEHPERWPTEAIPGLRTHDGFRCLRCESGGAFLTRDLPGMHRHISKQHQEKPSAHKMKQRPVPWEACKLQTFFSEPGAIRYFVVRVGGNTDQTVDAGEGRESDLDAGEASFFRSLDDDAKAADEDAKAGARVVEGLRRKGEIQAAFAVPRKGDDISSEEPELGAILDGMEEVLTETHRWCFDGPECRLTWPRQLALSRFRTSDSVTQKMRAFDPKKARSTVNTNFLYWKQLLSFYFHVIHRGRHFTKEDRTQTPEDCIRPTK